MSRRDPSRSRKSNRESLDGKTDHLSSMLDGDTSILLIRDVFPAQDMERASQRLTALNGINLDPLIGEQSGGNKNGWCRRYTHVHQFRWTQLVGVSKEC